MRERDEIRVVVIKGYETINPLAHNMKDTWDALLARKSGIGHVNPRSLADPRVWIAGLVKDWDEKAHVPMDKVDAFHRSHALSWDSAKRTLINAGVAFYDADGKPLLKKEYDPDSISIRIGTGTGGISTIAYLKGLIDEGDADMVDPFAIQRLLPEGVSTRINNEFNITGPGDTIAAACATGNRSISDAFTLLTNERTRAEVRAVLVGGAESAVTPEGITSFASAEMLTTDNDHPEEASCPLDEAFRGFVIAEGASIMLVADLEWALQHNLPIAAEVVGTGNYNDGDDMYFPNKIGTKKAIRGACRMAGIEPPQVNFFHFHAASTLGDATEVDAVKEESGENNETLCGSATKASIGHMLGAAAAFGSEVCVKAIETQTAPPTINLKNPVRRGIYLPTVPVSWDIEYAMSDGIGLNGINSMVLYRKHHPRTSRTFYMGTSRKTA